MQKGYLDFAYRVVFFIAGLLILSGILLSWWWQEEALYLSLVVSAAMILWAIVGWCPLLWAVRQLSAKAGKAL